MSVQSKTTLKSYFETGDTPTQSEFASLIDSFAHVNDRKSIISFPKHSSLTSADIGKLIMNDEGLAKVGNKLAQPTERAGQSTIEFTTVPTPPTMNGDLITLNANPVVGDYIKIFFKTFPFVSIGGTSPNEIVIGIDIPATMNNICSVLNNWATTQGFPMFISNNGIDLLTIDWNDPENFSQNYSKDGKDMITPDVRFGVDYLFELQTPATKAVQIAGDGTNWSRDKWTNPLFKTFGISIYLQDVLDATVASGTTIRSRAKYWETDLTAFADALALALDTKSADIIYTRTGNSFAISNNGNGSSISMVNWNIVDHSTDFGSVMTFSDDVVPIGAASDSFARPALGVLVEVEGSNAIIDAGLVVPIKISGTENVVCNSDIDFSSVQNLDPLINFLCISSENGTVETLGSFVNANPFVVDINRQLKLMSSMFYAPLSSGTVGETVFFQKCTPIVVSLLQSQISSSL